VNDERLLEAIIEELDWEPRVDATNIDVVVEENVVTLRGSVASYAEKLATDEAVRGIKGVRAVNQKIEVHVPTERAVADDEIARRLRDLLAWDPMVPENLIQVRVEKGWVTLTGEVAWQYQRRRAADCAHNLLGVTGVTNGIAVAPTARGGEVKKGIEDALRRSAIAAGLGDVRVSVQDGKVTLEGNVRTSRQQGLVGEIAWSAPGVWAVDNRVQVDPVFEAAAKGLSLTDRSKGHVA
jgi:osmotically-inducible protein OsmY